jgi:hypothetical protein
VVRLKPGDIDIQGELIHDKGAKGRKDKIYAPICILKLGMGSKLITTLIMVIE